jgi:hypothetical protein
MSHADPLETVTNDGFLLQAEPKIPMKLTPNSVPGIVTAICSQGLKKLCLLQSKPMLLRPPC